MGKTVVTLAFLGAAVCGAIVACSSPDRAPVALANTGGGDGGSVQPDTGTTPSDANVPDGNGGGTCVVTISGARSGTFPCKATAIEAKSGDQLILDVLGIVYMDPNVPTSLTKSAGFRCTTMVGFLKPGTYTATCQGGGSEIMAAPDGGQPIVVAGWQGPATVRVDSFKVDPAVPADDGGFTSYVITGSAEAPAAPTVFDGGEGPLKVVATF
ncbi:MAG: hypothetical protein HOO96_01095 [Polyangiaceae bacterium]|nr:hypothetical protein [Polyangiaceae bacterium]